MILRVPENIQLWELIAVVQIAQQTNSLIELPPMAVEWGELVRCSGVGVHAKGDLLDLQKAYQETLGSQDYYGEVLARVNGIGVEPLSPPMFPFLDVSEVRHGIIVCPFGLRPEFEIPPAIWRDIIRQLESYDQPVYVLGEHGQRLDAELSLTENQVLSDLPLLEKMRRVAAARVIVGVANSWTWLSSAWKLQRILIHPDSIRNNRWYPGVDNATSHFLLHNPEILSSPQMQIGIRKLMRKV